MYHGQVGRLVFALDGRVELRRACMRSVGTSFIACQKAEGFLNILHLESSGLSTFVGIGQVLSLYVGSSLPEAISSVFACFMSSIFAFFMSS